MRCPYCGKMNVDSATFCTSCGRDLRTGQQRSQPPAQGGRQPSYPPSRPAPQPPQPPPSQQPYQPYQPNAARPAPPPVQPGQPRPQPQPQPQQAGTQRNRTRSTTVTPGASPYPSSVPLQPPAPSAPEPPAPFPPRTVEHLRALEEGALEYSVVDSSVSVGKKKVVRISYRRAVGWQQAATLLKALKEQLEDRFDTVIIQGVLPQDTNAFGFTNGQLTCDRNVLLGSQKLTRYILETDNGFASDSVRVVLTEPQGSK